MSGEEWRPIPGWEGLYEVSDLGRVRSLDRVVHRKDGRTRRSRGRVLKSAPTKKGYRAVALRDGGRRATARTYQLVALAFLGPLLPDSEVRHKDGDATNNRLSNLCYGTQSENAKDSVSHGTHNNARKIRCGRKHMLKEPNLVAHLLRKYGRRSCLACSQAWVYRLRHPGVDLQVESDRYYARTRHLVEPDAC